MTKKITLTLEEELIEKLSRASLDLGKKKAQIVREALTAYLNATSKEKEMQAWKLKNTEAIEEYNQAIEKHGVFSDTLRGF